MTKTQACRVIHNCAVAYCSNLENRNVLFVAERDDVKEFFEALFLASNFHHLTGVVISRSITANAFYNRAIDDRITENDIGFSHDGTTRMKLDVLPKLMRIQYIARMVGNYDGSGNYLMADKIAGTTTAAMGFKKDGLYYYPSSALKTDVKNITIKPFLKVSAVFVKGINDEKYCEMTYIRKGLSITDIYNVPDVRNKVDIPPSSTTPIAMSN